MEVPVGAPAIRAWLSARLSPEAQDAWPRTDTGLLKTGADEIKRLAQDYPEVLPLLEVQKREKRLSTFGAALLDRVSPVTGRLHGDYALPTDHRPADLPQAEPAAAAASTPAPPSVPARARCCCPPTTARSSCAFWPSAPASRSCARRSPPARTSTW